MTLVRPELAERLHRWREAIAAGGLGLAGLWVLSLGGWLLQAIGALMLCLAALWGWQALRRMRFAPSGDAPGMVEVVEGQIAYFGPVTGGAVGLPDLVELRLLTMRGRKVWRLRQSDGQALLIPVEAHGADALFDAFASLPGLDTGALVDALADPVAQGGNVVALASGNRLVWARAGRGMVRG